MADKIERIYQYRVLVATRDRHDIPLEPAAATRFERLSQQLARGVPKLDDRDPYTLMPEPMQVQFIVGSQFGAGTVHNASADGLAILTADAPALGSRLLLHVREPRYGVEYTFPCVVMSRVVKGLQSMGVAFDGMPSQSRIGGKRSGVWRFDEPTPTGRQSHRKKQA